MTSSQLARSTTTSQTDFSALKETAPDRSHSVSREPSIHDPEKDLERPLSRTPGTEVPAGPVRPYNKIQWIAALIAMIISALLYGLDTTIVADIQATVVEDFGAVAKLGWLGIGFPLGSTASILPLSKAYRSFDVKWIYIASLVMFEAGSALCGGAPTMDALIVGRVWAGAGGAGMYLGVLNLISVNTTPAENALYTSMCGAFWGIGCILGPVIGGSFADSSATWRWAFYINLVLFGVCAPVYFFVIKSFMPQPDVPFSERVKRMDWLGILLYAAMYATFVIPFTFGGTQWAWSDGRTIAVIVVFGVILVTFALQQTFAVLTTKEDRLFPIDFLGSRTLVLLYVATSGAATALFVNIYYIPLFFSFVYGDNGVDAAVRLLPFICIAIFCIMLNGALMPKFGYYQPWYLAAGLFLILGGSLFYKLVDSSSSKSMIYGFSVLCAAGAGLSQQAAYAIAPTQVPMHRIADAVGFINAAQIGATAIALTITSAVFQNIGFQHVSDALAGLGFTAEDIHAALAGAKSTVFTTVPPEVRQKVVDAIVKAIGDGYILTITGGAVCTVAAILMKRERVFMEHGAGGA